MYAIIQETGGKQYRVSEGRCRFNRRKLTAAEGEEVVFVTKFLTVCF